MKVPIYAALLAAALSGSTHARLGETVGQSIRRYGPLPEGQSTLGNGSIRWHRPSRKFLQLDFRENRCITERHIGIAPRDLTIDSKIITPALRSASELPWRSAGEDSVTKWPFYTDGKHLAYFWYSDIGGHLDLIIAPIPEKRSDKLSAAENHAFNWREKTLPQLAKENARAKDREKGIYHLLGKVASRFDEGILVRAEYYEDEGISSFVLLTGIPHETDYVDGDPIAIRARLDGTFQYRAAIGSIHTIHKLAYVGNLKERQ
jgi:hypothetical protein